MMTWKSLRGMQMAAVLAATLAGPRLAQGQVPGAPVLQNAFANPGLAFAANYGTGSGQSLFGAAAGLGLSGGKLQVSAAAGVQSADDVRRGAYGGRVSLNLWNSAGGSLGAAAFAGIGGAPRTRNDGVETSAAVMNIPVGISVGYRRSLGARGVSVYASPIYTWSRAEINDASGSDTSFGGAVGVDFGLTRSIGLTAGGQFGKGGEGDSGSLLGFAVSFVPGR